MNTALIKTLTQHGNSTALIIDKPILEMLGITIETPLRITTDGKSLIVSPISDSDRARVLKHWAKINKRYAKTFKKLADTE
jgi:antitoxin component of MazEF toxin-antitoxin module